jgi:hypothetical protein
LAAGYKFVNVPKTFTTKAAALQFLSNSPGYVSRQSAYLQKYWPGLMSELEQSKRKRQELDKRRGSVAPTAKPTPAARKYSAETGIFVPPAFVAKPNPKASNKPARATLVKPPASAPVDDGTEREKFQLGLSKKKQTPNRSDLVPDYVSPVDRMKKSAGSFGSLPDAPSPVDIAKGYAGISKTIGYDLPKAGIESAGHPRRRPQEDPRRRSGWAKGWREQPPRPASLGRCPGRGWRRRREPDREGH